MSADLASGRHKIFLGYAPGVGKTFAMLDEASRRAKRGKRVVAGVLNDAGKPQTQEIAAQFPRAAAFDVATVTALSPDYVMVDDLSAVDGDVPRWKTVQALLDSGISVLSTVNVSALESLNDHVADITGIRVALTVPDRVLHDAEEIEIVDVTPRALLNRLERGDVVPPEQVEALRKGLFREGNLSALREMALREVAGKVDEDLEEYRKAKRIEKPWAAVDRVMVCISPTRSSLRLIRRAWRMGQRMHAEVLCVYVEDGDALPTTAKQILADDFALAERLGIATITLKGELADSLIKFAKERNVTQIVLGHPERTRFQHMMKPSILSELVRELKTVDFVVCAHETE